MSPANPCQCRGQPTTGPPAALHGGNSTRLALRELEMAVDCYLRLGVAQSTHWTYNTGQQHYLRFCQHTGLNPIPATEHQLMLFAAYLALKGLKWQTIKTYLSAVRHFHLLRGPQSGFPDGTGPRPQLMLHGIKKATSTFKNARLPITSAILR